MSADVVAWLRSPEGEEWSRSRALAGDPGPVVYLQVLWRATGPLSSAQDPCGSGPVHAGGGSDG